MEIRQSLWKGAAWHPEPPGLPGSDLVLAFGSTEVLRRGEACAALRAAHPRARIVGCSTAGEILGTQVTDDTLVATAVRLEHSRVHLAGASITSAEASDTTGEALAAALPMDGLVHVFVLSEGNHVNGSALVAGLTRRLPAHVTVTGGLAGDGARFGETLVVTDGVASPGAVVALGLYGERLRVGFGSLGGWDAFGPEREVTRARGNVLYELDGQSALELYKRYLGSHADELPASALLFPLSIRTEGGGPAVVRTILAVDEAEQSMTFAGDVPVGAYARLMKANFDRLIDGATGAARTSHQALRGSAPELAVLISCVGRKLVLKQRVEEEVESVREVLGDGTALAGFYSYGEISPFTPSARCELHNQTMTITTLSER